MEFSGRTAVSQTALTLLDRRESEPVAVEGSRAIEVLGGQFRDRLPICERALLEDGF